MRESPETILIAYDGSDHARAAVAAAGRLLSSRAVVACVWTPIGSAASMAVIGTPASVASTGAERLDAAAREKAEQIAGEGAALAREAGLDAEPRAVEGHGSPWHALVRCAEELGAGAIVSGTRGRSGIAAAMLGSTAQGLLHHAHCPVLIVGAD